MTPELKSLCDRLEAVESDSIGSGLSNNHYRNPDGPEAAAKLREMVGALESVRGFLMSAPMESGYCCCGSPVKDHGMDDGHSPVNDLAYAANRQVEMIDAALGGSHG